MGLRLAFGSCSCNGRLTHAVDIAVCRALADRLQWWRETLPEGLNAIPRELFTEETVEGIHVTFGTHRSVVSDTETLVVESALVHTWRRPTFITLGAIGRIFANGL